MQTAKAMGSIPSHTDVFVHSGVVSRVEGHSVTVTLDQNLHCESCRAKGACGVSDGAAAAMSRIGLAYRSAETIMSCCK